MPIPEKDFYTLDEIAECWACIGIQKSSFLDLARKDILVFSFYEKDIGSHREISIKGDEVVTKAVSVSKFISPGYKFHAIRYLCSEDSRRILEAGSNQEVTIIVSYSSPTISIDSRSAKIKHLNKNDLGVSIAEKKRFEKTYGYNSINARIYRLWSWIKEPSNREPLTWIAIGFATGVSAAWAVFVHFN